MTRLMVLGLLRLKPLSGYEIQQILQTSQSDKWAGILPGSIYHALKKMDKEGLVEVESVEHTGHRAKAIYKITENGEIEFKLLLKESLERSSVVLPSSLYTALSFLHEISNEELIKAIETQLTTLERELADLKLGQKKKESVMKLDPFTLMAFENMFQQYELQMDFLKKMKGTLNENPLIKAPDFPESE
jgi:DNA-binding PadR family transcriptional regulator